MDRKISMTLPDVRPWLSRELHYYLGYYILSHSILFNHHTCAF